MEPVTIFVTYNPRNEFEQTLAVRLQTLGAIHGYQMLMPDRYGGSALLNQETQYRIKSADYVIFFSTSPMTPIVQAEIQAAYEHLQDKSRIVIVYDRVKNLQHGQNCTEVYIDTSKNSVQEILQTTIQAIHANEARKKSKQDTVNAIGALLLVGLGLLVLNSSSSK